MAFSALVWLLDKYEREPLRLLLGAFLWGAIPAAVVSLVLEVVLGVPLWLLLGDAPAEAIGVALGAPIIEELAKGAALILLALLFSREFDGVMDGIVYGALVGFGFAMTENIAYLVSCGPVGSVECQALAFWRTLVFGLNHAFYTALTGAAIGYAMTKRDAKRWLAPPLGLWAAMMSHMLHNLASLVGSAPGMEFLGLLLALVPDWGTVLLLGAVIFLAWERERGWMEEHLLAEIARGTLSQVEYETLMSWRRRAGAQLSALRGGGWSKAMAVRRRQFLATELAFEKARRARGENLDRKKLHALREGLRPRA